MHVLGTGVITVLALSLLVAPEVVIMVTAGATGGGGFLVLGAFMCAHCTL